MKSKAVFNVRGNTGTVSIDGKVFNGDVTVYGDGTVVANGVEQGSVFGSVVISVNGNADYIETTLGSVKVTGEAKAIKTMSGDVICGAVCGNVQTMSGDITCTSITGKASTMSGDIRGR